MERYGEIRIAEFRGTAPVGDRMTAFQPSYIARNSNSNQLIKPTGFFWFPVKLSKRRLIAFLSRLSPVNLAFAMHFLHNVPSRGSPNPIIYS